MIKKNGFNIRLFVFIIGLLTILSCVKNSPGNGEGILMQTDRNFSAMSVKDGLSNAFITYFPVLFPSFLLRAIEANIPNTDRTEKMMKPVCMAETSPG